jgi:uncharacterized protein (TIGR03382 family)
LVAVAALAALPGAAATRQDSASYPSGVVDVSNSPLEPGQDFLVQVGTDAAPDAVTVTVCRFSSVQADGPDVCFMNLAAAAAGDGMYQADTGSVQHPAWKAGWVLGYKVTLKAGGAESHAPDRTTASGDGDYYRIVVGSDQSEPAPTGSAVVEDGAPQVDPAPATTPSGHTAGGPAFAPLLALVACAALAARRR